METGNEISVDFDSQEECSSPDSGSQDVYFNIKRDTEGQYDNSCTNLYNPNHFEAYSPENGEIVASASPDQNHINALFTQTSPRMEMSSYDEGQISKIHVLTPNELSIKAANELAALEMNDGLTAEATDRCANLNSYNQGSKKLTYPYFKKDRTRYL